jgi:hypothetical protein
MDKRFDYLYRMCIASIGIPVGKRDDSISVDLELSPGTRVPADALGPKVPLDGMEPIRKYYTNSIEEYRYLLALGNKTRSRTNQAKKLKSAESAVRFLQYAKSQSQFMEFLSPIDPVTYKRILIYSNPSILKSGILKSDAATPVNPKDPIEKA